MTDLLRRLFKPEPALRPLLFKLFVTNAVCAGLFLAMVIAIALPLVPYVAIGCAALNVWILATGLIARRRTILAGQMNRATRAQRAAFAVGSAVVLLPVTFIAGGIVVSSFRADYQQPTVSTDQMSSVQAVVAVLAPTVADAGGAPLSADQIAAAVEGVTFESLSPTPTVSQVQQETAEQLTRVDVWFEDEAAVCVSITSHGLANWEGDLVSVDSVSSLDSFGEYVDGYCDQE